MLTNTSIYSQAIYAMKNSGKIDRVEDRMCQVFKLNYTLDYSMQIARYTIFPNRFLIEWIFSILIFLCTNELKVILEI